MINSDIVKGLLFAILGITLIAMLIKNFRETISAFREAYGNLVGLIVVATLFFIALVLVVNGMTLIL